MIATTATEHELILDLTGQKWLAICPCGWSSPPDADVTTVGNAHLAHVEAALAVIA